MLKLISALTRFTLTMALLVVALEHPALAEKTNRNIASPAATTNLPATADDTGVPNLTAAEQKLFESLQSAQYVAAKKQIQSGLKQSQSKSQRAELLNLLAFVDCQLSEERDALKDLQSLEDDGDAASSASSNRSRAKTLERLGYVYLRMRKKGQAIEKFKSALPLLQTLSPTDPVRIGILEPLVGCLLQDDDYSAAQPFAEQLVSISQTRAASGDLNDVGSLFWSEIQLLQIYKNTKNPDLHAKLFSKALPLLDQLLLIRTKYEGNNFQETKSASQKLQKAMLASYIAFNKPATLSDYLWIRSQFRMRSLPLITWQPQDNKPTAVILCVHGLGLENRAFGAFARKMIGKNFAVYAMDVRGFGAWQSEYGEGTVSFDHALNDISALVKLIRIRQPGLPVYLLGESMGGAIVLRAASEFGHDLDGVISSVPSADQYGAGKMARKVAFHFLRNRNKPFDIGTQVTKQATSEEELREDWMTDPKAKIDLSPMELLKFDRFMKETQKRCSLIDATPVMVVQGMADKLVKPKGTYEMYDGIKSPDKTMIVLGSAEHLIFETPKQYQVLLDGLATWLNDHTTQSSKNSATH